MSSLRSEAVKNYPASMAKLRTLLFVCTLLVSGQKARWKRIVVEFYHSCS